MSMDAHTLQKKISRTCDEVARALLGSLLTYVSDRAGAPQRAADPGPSLGSSPQSEEAGRRPTRFQLLQAKFMGTGREHLKRTREVGRLISKDKQGPSRSRVSATIDKLLEKTKGGGSCPGQRPLASEKPRWGPPGGKSTVKTILKKFLAAEEKEKKEKEAGEKPPGWRPRVVGRGTVLSKLREKFEQSSCLRSEASLLPVHRAARRSLQRRMHRPELRVLHTATMATSCTRTPPARFLACTAEPLPALSIATVVCSPRSWLSHCAKVSHLDARRRPRRDASMSPDSGDTECSGDKVPGTGTLSEEPRGQPKPSESSTTQGATRGDSHLAPDTTEGGPQQGSSWASGEALPHHGPPLSPRGPAAGDRTVGEGPTDHVWRLKEEGTGEGPDAAMTVCSSGDEAGGSLPASDREPVFATQKHLAEQDPAQQIPPLATPAVQATRRAQPALESPRVTLWLPVVHEMPPPPGPPQSTSPGRDRQPRVSGGCSEGASAAPASEDKEASPAAGRLSPSCRAPASPGATSEQGSPEALRAAAPTGPGDLQAVLIADSPESGPAGKGPGHGPASPSEGRGHRTGHGPASPAEGRGHRTGPGRSVPELSCQRHPWPESPEVPTPNQRTCPSPGATGSSSGSQQGPAPREGGAAPAPAQDFRGPGSPTTSDGRVLCGQEERKGPLAESALPLGVAQEGASCGTSENRLSSSDEPRKPSSRASRATAPGGKIPSPTGDRKALPGDTWASEDRKAPSGSFRDPEDSTAPSGSSKDPEDSTAPSGSSRDPEDSTAPSGSSRDPEDSTAPLGSSRDPEDSIGPSGSARDPGDRKAPSGSARDPGDRRAPSGSARDPGDRRAPSGSARDPGDRRAPSGSSRDPGDRKAPSGSARDPGDRRAPSGSARDPGDRRAPSGSSRDPGDRKAPLGCVRVPEDCQGEEWMALDAEERTVRSAGHRAAEGKGPLGAGRPREPSRRHLSTPGESSEHESRAAEGSPWEERAGRLPPAGVPLSAGPEEALAPVLAPAEHLPCASLDSAAVGAGGRAGTAAPGGPQPRDAASQVQPPSCPTPRRRLAGPLAQQAQDRGGLPPAAHIPPGLARALSPPSRPAPEQEARPAGGRAASRAERSGPTQGGVGEPESLRRPGARVTGRERSHQAQDPDGSGNRGAALWGGKTELHAAGPRAQAAQDVAGGQRAAAMEKPCQPRAAGQECPLGPSGKPVRSPAQEGSPKAVRSLSTPSGTPGGTCGLATQGPASGTASQAWGQSDSSAGRARTAGACGEPQRPSCRLSGQGSPRAPRPTPGSWPLAGQSAAASAPEPADGSAQPRADAGGCPTPLPPAPTGLPHTAGAERDLSEGECHRRSSHFAKYKAQSFSDQRAFDLSFRPLLLRASDTFEAPK